MKKLFLLISGLLILASVPITILFINQNQELRSRAAPATSLSLTPSSITVNPNENFTLDATVNTGQNQIVAVEIHVTYDPQKLEALSITNGPLFPNILASGIIDNGVASITVGAPSAAQPVTGTGTAASIRFKALEATTSPISVRFGQETFAGDPAEGATNALISINPATITISGSASVTNTPTPTQSAVTPTATPIVTGSPSPTPTGTITVTPTPTTSATSGVLSILSPANNSTVHTATPTISGKAPAGSTVTITVYSDTPITGTANTNTSGNWSYTPTTALADGPHTVIASAVDPSTQATLNATSAFTVDTSSDGVPVSGTFETTILLLTLAIVLLLGGALIPFVL